MSPDAALEGLWTVPPANEDDVSAAQAHEREALLESAVLAISPRYDVHGPDAFKLIDRDLVLFDDRGMPRNLLQVMDNLVEAHSWFVGKYPRPPAPPGRPMPAARRQRVEAGMTRDQRMISRVTR
jgi:hypothetical protein